MSTGMDCGLSARDGGHCITCADEALEGRIVRIDADALARVELGGRILDVALDLVEGAAIGDRVLVHAGVAIARVGSG